MTYQTSFLAPSRTQIRREPGRRNGESWISYCTRHETWRRQTFTERTPQERERTIRLNQEFRETLLRSNEVFCYHQVEKAKKDYKPERDVFFWFGGEIGFPGVQSQYVNQGTLDLLLKMAAAKKMSGRGKVRVNFGPCLGGR